MRNLIIVESPTKARTISRFLGKEFIIESSYGHVRDLPQKQLGIDLENNFEPKYVVARKNQKRVTGLRRGAEKADLVYFATDEDREGEAIAWHLQQIFKLPEEKTKRIAFHEITQEAVLTALKNPRSIDLNLVDAQQARRVLDRLVGYKLSPFLWKKIAKGLSAGRVQSPAVRLIVEREKEIENFKPQEYWTIVAAFNKAENQKFEAQLCKINNKTLKKLDITSKEEADEILKNLEGADYQIDKIEKREVKKSPLPPFITSTLQQTANSKLGFSTKQTMVLAQQLYEGVELGKEGAIGLITYMRTDSVNLSEKFLLEAKNFIQQEFGVNYYPEKPRLFKTSSKNAQEAHEAIRPTDINLKPEEIKSYLSPQQFRLYQSIWQRAVACQMKPALIDSTIINVIARRPEQNENYTFRANGSTIKFDGFLRVYPLKTEENILPQLEKDEILQLADLKSRQHFTQPPGRYTEAALVKALEKYGIGRPSTYAPIISTIQTRNYVTKEEKKLKPTEIGILVNDVLVEHFPKIVDYQFTAHMEEDLDKIAVGEMKWTDTIQEFYQPFIENLEKKDKNLTKEKIIKEEKTDKKCPQCGSPMVVKFGRFGKFLACSKFPECKTTQPFGEPDQSIEEKIQEKCPKCGQNLVIKFGRFGKFLACSNYPNCKFTKPIIKSTGIKCPQCQTGEIIEKKSKRGRVFYACSEYPKCKFALWSKPVSNSEGVGEKCPKCDSLLVYGAKNTIRCSDKKCDFKKE